MLTPILRIYLTIISSRFRIFLAKFVQSCSKRESEKTSKPTNKQINCGSVHKLSKKKNWTDVSLQRTSRLFSNILIFVSFHSAGGIGVILNLDRLARRLKMAGLKVEVRGLADSGWYLDMPAQETNKILQGMA